MTFGSREGTKADVLDTFAAQQDDPEYIAQLDGDLRAIHLSSLKFQEAIRIERTKNNPKTPKPQNPAVKEFELVTFS